MILPSTHNRPNTYHTTQTNTGTGVVVVVVVVYTERSSELIVYRTTVI